METNKALEALDRISSNLGNLQGTLQQHVSLQNDVSCVRAIVEQVGSAKEAQKPSK